MARYAAFLRGINLGARHKVSMPALRELAEGLGWTDVATYINSGNLVFDATGGAPALEKKLARALDERFGFEIPVAIRTRRQLDDLLADNPWPDGDPGQVTVAFLTGPPTAAGRSRVEALAAEHEEVRFAGRDVWVLYGQGLGRSKLAAAFSDAIGVAATVRNLRTVEKVRSLC